MSVITQGYGETGLIRPNLVRQGYGAVPAPSAVVLDVVEFSSPVVGVERIDNVTAG